MDKVDNINKLAIKMLFEEIHDVAAILGICIAYSQGTNGLDFLLESLDLKKSRHCQKLPVILNGERHSPKQ